MLFGAGSFSYFLLNIKYMSNVDVSHSIASRISPRIGLTLKKVFPTYENTQTSHLNQE